VINYIETKEYDTKQSVWNTKKATMSKKVAEAQGLRSNFQELFAGTLEESETPVKRGNVVEVNAQTADELIEILESAQNEIDYNVKTEEVQKRMAHLSTEEKAKVIARGKELRKKFTAVDATTVTEKDVIEAEEKAKQETLPLD
jgi:hypothetical protein